MSRIYSAVMRGVAVSAIQDLFELVASSDSVVKLLAVYISQSSEEKDAEDEQLRLEFTLGYTSSGSGGSSVTPEALDGGDTAFAGTCEINNTTQASTGTARYMHAESFNVRAGYVYVPTPKCEIVLKPSERLVIELPVAPADEITMDGTIIFEEIGS